ncbi:acyl carrier protein [Streptomyces tanashiensis]
MSSGIKTFELGDLKRILKEGVGADESVDLEGDVLDVIEALGYESLAMLETGTRIEREFGVVLTDETLAETATPRRLIEAVNVSSSVPTV